MSGLWLMLSVGEVRCALPARQVVRVLPRAELHPLTGLPAFVAGQLLFGGRAVPILDLCQLMLDRPSAPAYSTRIVLVDYPLSADSRTPLGLLAERVTEASRLDASQFQPCTLRRGEFLGKVVSGTDGVVQELRLPELLSEELREQLFLSAETAR